jgi:hypothetical protein
MRRFTLGIIALMVILLLPCAWAENKNLVQNSGFEQIDKGFPSVWRTFTASAREMFALDREEVFAGRYALHAKGDFSVEWAPIFSNMIPVTPGEECTLGGYVKTKMTDGELIFALREIDSNGKSVIFRHVQVPKSSDWAFYSRKFKVGDNTTAVQIYIVMRKVSGDAWFDDVIVVKGDLKNLAELSSKKKSAVLRVSAPVIEPGKNLLPGGGFELADAGWVFVPGNKKQSGGVDKTVAFAGSASYMQEHKLGGMPGSFLHLAKPVNIAPNKKYMISGWVKTSPDGHSNWTSIPADRHKRDEGACMVLIFRDEDNRIVGDAWTRTLQTGGEWQRLEAVGSAPVNAVTADVRLALGDFKGRAWFDGVRLEMAENPASYTAAWRLPKDSYAAGKLPPIFKADRAKASLASAGAGDELSIVIKPEGAGPGSLFMPPIDTAVPGNFEVAGEYRTIGTKAAELALQSVDVDGRVILEKKFALPASSGWAKFAQTCAPDTMAACIRAGVRAKGAGSAIEVRNMVAHRLTTMSLEDYSGMSADSGWKAAWIWYPENAAETCKESSRYFVKSFNVSGPVKNAGMQITADNEYIAYINGKKVAEGNSWRDVTLFDVAKALKPGANTIAIKAYNVGGPAGLLMELAITTEDGKTLYVSTDKDFATSTAASEGWMNPGASTAGWKAPLIIGSPPSQPWGMVRHFSANVKGMQAGAARPAPAKASAGSPDVEIAWRNGVPAILVNGKPICIDQYWMAGTPYDVIVENCKKSGVVYAPIMGDIDWSGTTPKIDFKALDEQIHQIIKIAPDALISITPDTTAEHTKVPWSAHNPTELYVSDLGQNRVPGYSGEVRTFATYASEKWQRDIDSMLVQLVEHVKKSDYAPNVIGYQLSTYEWFQWEWMRGRIDTSPQMQAAFRKWLKEKYITASALQRAWGNPNVNFANAQIPSLKERRDTVDGVFRDLIKNRNAIDFNRFYSELTANVLTRQARTIKQANGKNTLVCTFYGYTKQMLDGVAREASGHMAVKKSLESGLIDYQIGPSDGYIYERGIGGTGGYMGVPGTYYLNGSMWLNQPDFRTHWSTQDVSRTENTFEDVHLFRREFAMSLTGQSYVQYLDFSTGYTMGDHRLAADFARYAKVQKFASTLNRTPENSGMAVVISEECGDYIGTERGLFDHGSIYHQRPLFFRAGTPHRDYLLSDLTNPRMPDHKVWVFPNAWQLTAADRDAIKKKCMKNGNVVLFVYAPGYVGDTISIENMNSLLGIKLAQMEGAQDTRVTISPDASLPWLKDSPSITYGRSTWSPLFYANDPSAKVLGRYVGSGKPGLVMKDFGSYKVVYSGTAMLPPDLLRDLARLAGDNIYINTGDALYADRNFVGVHARSTGAKTICLPAKADVYDVINCKTVAVGVKQFTVQMDAFTTSLFYIGDAKKAKAFFEK